MAKPNFCMICRDDLYADLTVLPKRHILCKKHWEELNSDVKNEVRAIMDHGSKEWKALKAKINKLWS